MVIDPFSPRQLLLSFLSYVLRTGLGSLLAWDMQGVGSFFGLSLGVVLDPGKTASFASSLGMPLKPKEDYPILLKIFTVCPG